MRFEYYRVDEHYREAETKLLGMKVPFKPVFRAGLNYELGEYSFLRASFGQGYRYPSVTEKFILKDIGGMGAYPNSQLKAEEGYNAELGLKQGYQFGPVKGFVDVAGFYTRYKDMIEFRFGLFNKTTFAYIGANQDAMAVSHDLGIKNAMNFEATVCGTVAMSQKLNNSRSRWFDRIAENDVCADLWGGSLHHGYVDIQ